MKSVSDTPIGADQGVLTNMVFKKMQVSEIAELLDKVVALEKKFVEYLTRNDYYDNYPGYIDSMGFQLIRRRCEIYSALYKSIGIETEEIPEIPACDGAKVFMSSLEEDDGPTDETIEDYYSAFDDDITKWFKEFTTVSHIGDFKEIQTAGYEMEIEDIPLFYSDASSYGFLSDKVMDMFLSAARDILPEVQEDEYHDFLSGDLDDGDPYDFDDYIYYNEMIIIRSKKVGQALSFLQSKPGRRSETEALFLKIVNDLFFVNHITTGSSITLDGVEKRMDGEVGYTLAECHSTCPDQEEGSGVPCVLRNLPMKLYAYMLQELADRILEKMEVNHG